MSRNDLDVQQRAHSLDEPIRVTTTCPIVRTDLCEAEKSAIEKLEELYSRGIDDCNVVRDRNLCLEDLCRKMRAGSQD